MVEYIRTLFDGADNWTAYLILGVSAYIENVFPPIPGDTVTVFGAYLISHGLLDFWGVYISTSIGSILGFFTMYILAVKIGRPFTKSRFFSKIFNESRLKKVEFWFAKYGYWVIAGNRFLAGTRSVISIFAGLFHLNWPYVLLLSAISVFVWNGLLIYLGYILGVNWESILTIITQYNRIFMILLFIAAGVYLYKRYKKRLKRKEINE